eukprot:2713243-Amphidinium_carterae.1
MKRACHKNDPEDVGFVLKLYWKPADLSLTVHLEDLLEDFLCLLVPTTSSSSEGEGDCANKAHLQVRSPRPMNEVYLAPTSVNGVVKMSTREANGAECGIATNPPTIEAMRG